MKSNYKSIGQYIQVVDLRNAGDKKDNLLGVSVNKVFIKSIANTVGTDFTTYRIVKKNQFTYIPDTSRRGDKIGIALLEQDQDGLVSQAYTVFEIADLKKLDPQYLMMWFRRPEFDRYARFISHGSVREIFTWEDMCNVSLPIPHIDKQREIVKEYNTIVNRIKLNEQLCQKLEETAHVFYKEWFVDKIDSENLPEGWRLSNIGNEVETLGGGTPSTEVDEYWIDGEILWYSPTDITNNDSVFIFESANKITKMGLNKSSAKLFPANSLMMTSRATVGKLAINTTEATTNQGFITMIPTIKMNVYYLYCWAKSQVEEIVKLASGSTFLEISKSDFRNLTVIVPDDQIITDFKKNVSPIFELIKSKNKENQKLTQLKDLLLSKLATIEN